MNKRMGIVASFTKVAFKKDGVTVFEGTGSLGCIRQGEPKDSHSLIRQAFTAFAQTSSKDAADFDTAIVKGREFTRAELTSAKVVPAAKKRKA